MKDENLQEISVPLLEVVRKTYRSYTEGYNQGITDALAALTDLRENPIMAERKIKSLWKDDE